MSSVERSVCKGNWMKEPVEFKSKLESIMPAEELLFDATPAFGIYREFLSHATCFDIETEILTMDGWKHYNELKEGLLVATLNSNSELEYQPIQQIIITYYKGKMYRLKTKALDILVTPNHNFYVDVGGRNVFRLREAQEVFGMNKAFKRDAKWSGIELDTFVLPRIEIKWRNSSRVKVYEEKKIPVNIWVKFFGLWLAEGSASNFQRNYSVRISNKNMTLLQEMFELLKPFFAVRIYDDKELIIGNKQLYLYLKQFGHAKDKWIPSEIKKLSPLLLRTFLEFYLKGDGNIRFEKNGKKPHITACTISKRLADDLMEIALKIGICATIRSRNRIGRKTVSQDGKEFITRNIEYDVTFSWQNTPYIQKTHKSNIEKWIDYDGIVWCVTVQNHIIYVRRNGFPVWSGNSHPAKMNTRMLEFLVKTWTKPGDTVLDPMAGSGSTGVVAALHGRNAILVELEAKFYEWIEKARENVEKYSTFASKGRIVSIHGDARRLSELLNGVDVAITSPPYLKSAESGSGVNRQREGDVKIGCSTIGRTVTHPEAIDNTKEYGSIDTVITSPPYADTYTGGGDPEKRRERLIKAGYDPKEFLGGRARNTVLKHYGEVDVCITSPPYSEALSEKAGGGSKKNASGVGITSDGEKQAQGAPAPYSASRENIGNLSHGNIDAIVTSPPYEASVSDGNEGPLSGGNEKKYGRWRKGTAKMNSYTQHGEPCKVRGTSLAYKRKDNIGNLRKETYLEAMSQVYAEMFKVLKPNGLAIIVVKPFQRNLKVIDLSYDTYLLMKRAGFVLEKLYKLRLRQLSFWRVLAYKKHPDVPRIMHEYVIVARKQAGGVNETGGAE